jgi:hypothetical protein
MTTSGTTSWNLNVAKIIEVASRRAFSQGSNKGMLSSIDAKNARDCLNMVLTDLTNEGHTLNKLEFKTFPTLVGQPTYSLSTDVLDIFDVVYARYNGLGSDPLYTESSLTRIDLAAYNQINNKGMQSSLSSEFALHRGMNEVTMYVYPTSDNTDDEIRYWALTRIEDVTEARQDVDLSYRYTNALIAGTAYYLAIENPEDSELYELRLKRLKMSYQESVDSAFGEDRDRVSMYIKPGFR